MRYAGPMDRPAYLREDLFRQIISELERADIHAAANLLRDVGYDVTGNAAGDDLLRIVLAQPSRYLAHTGILSQSNLLAGLFIEFDDGELDEGHTYLIDWEAAEEIAANETVILLRSGGEGAMMPRARIERAFRNGCVIDYKETPSRRK